MVEKKLEPINFFKEGFKRISCAECCTIISESAILIERDHTWNDYPAQIFKLDE
jgi:hypothetical protein